MRVLIVDDETPARQRLAQLVTELQGYTVVAEAANGMQALQLCAELHPECVLLDVRMPELTGLQVAQQLQALPEPPAIIFTTAYDQYAVEAFEAEAIGYLLKPVRKEKLAHALSHANRISKVRLRAAAHRTQQTQRREQVCARLGEQLRMIPVTDIYYFLAEQKYVTVKHRLGADLIDESLKELETEFAADFIRIHRNALVAEKFIAAVERSATGQYHVRTRDDGPLLQVSRRHAPALLRRLRQRD